MPKIDEMPKYRANLSKHTHDLSHDFGFTCSTAHLLPVFHDYLNAGETVEVGFNYFLRTQPLQSAAMSKLKCHTEYFFVPMQLLYQPFGSFLYGITDEYSSMFANQLMDVLPVLDLDHIMDAKKGASTRSYYKQNGVTVGESDAALIYRLADMFGFDPTRMVTGSVSTEHVNPNVFPYQYLAYNCIYEYYYRLDNREIFDQNLFNWDQYYQRTTPIDADDNIWDIFYMRYRPLGNDYFTDVKVSPIVDVLNLNNKNNLQIANNWLSRNLFGSLAGDIVLKSGSIGSPGDFVSFSPTGAGFNDPSLNVSTVFGFNSSQVANSSKDSINGADINTANIRAMFASEKLWSITGRAKKHYDDQTLAHFGFEVPHDPKHEITCFGHDVSDINIGEVISTSNTWDGTNGSPLAEIAGKGYGSQSGKKHKFTAPCHGVVMVIYSVTLDRNYIQGVPKYNVMRDRSDLYQPEYDHLGMQPMFMYEVGDYVLANHGNIYGWQYRYEQWKRRYNRLTRGFSNAVTPGYGVGAFSSWFNVSYQNLTDDTNKANTSSFVNFLNLPTDINSIMLVSYQVNWSGSGSPYSYDPFIVASHIDCKKISTMSDYSLPRLDA